MAHQNNQSSGTDPSVIKSLPKTPSKPWLRPVCFFVGHKEVPAEDKPGWFKIACGRCGLDFHRPWFRRTKRVYYRTAQGLVGLANRMIGENERNDWFHGYAQITNTDYIAKSHLESLVKQGDDMLLSEYLSDEGWICLADHPEEIQPMFDQLSKGVELLRTKEEQEELNRYDD